MDRPPDEWLDVLRDDGSPSGERIVKAEAHRTGAWHRAVHVWIVTPDARVLLQRRAATKENFPSLWDVSCAGHVSAGERAIDAAIRELAEELGLQVAAEEVQPIGVLRQQCVLNEGKYIDNEVHELFVLRREVDLSALTLQAEEVDDAALIAIDELRARVEGHDPSLVPHALAEYALLWNGGV
ncbi:MAG TPA: NUDIX domain-containing protein [Thermoanaerobaculia bacterium]|nr:NUDIX domain-containing protein [Thermoanaerobaculia bacterium]